MGQRSSRWFAVLAVALLLAAGTACRSPFQREVACTLIGCDDHLLVQLPDGAVPDGGAVRVCLDGSCATWSPGGEFADVDDPATIAALSVDDAGLAVLRLREADWSGAHDVEVALLSATGAAERTVEASVTFEATFPNGPDCPPPCWAGRLDL